MNELIPISFYCSYCGELNESSVDPSGGKSQSYTEDCTVCCRPNALHISVLPNGEVSLDVDFEE